ncbi:MAG TPA: GyrI-like domain-containing protein [Acidimicrobiia bacterium]
MAQTKPKVPKLDLRKQYKEFYLPSAKEVVLVDVPEFLFVVLDGSIKAGVRPGDSEAFRDAMGAMYGVGYGLKFMSKLRNDDPIDFTVMAVEGLWSTESGAKFAFDWREPSLYTLLMMQPDHITSEMFYQALADARAKQPNPMLDRIRLERWQEGTSIQIMHIGPYADEPATLDKMVAFAEEHGYVFNGRHHEIYIGDPTRSKPENLKTVLRHPVKT